MKIAVLGEPRYDSPIKHFVNENVRLPNHIIQGFKPLAEDDLLFELAGAREKIYFDPLQTRVGIVTCGGLSPGLNDVIRSLYLELHMLTVSGRYLVFSEGTGVWIRYLVRSL